MSETKYLIQQVTPDCSKGVLVGCIPLNELISNARFHFLGEQEDDDRENQREVNTYRLPSK